jgi:hypothetical protein
MTAIDILDELGNIRRDLRLLEMACLAVHAIDADTGNAIEWHAQRIREALEALEEHLGPVLTA